MRVAVIAPHPDDEILGCGGTIARHVERGDDVHVVVVSRGVPEIFPPEEIEATRRELRAAHDVLGVDAARFLDFPAPKLDLVPRHALADALATVLGDLRSDVLYVPHWGDLHGDHQAVFDACLVAARPIGDHPVRRLLCYETLSETEWAGPRASEVFTPSVFIDVSSVLDRKLKAMACYRSQLKSPPHPRSLEGIEALARVRGSTVGCAAAEAFFLVREIL